MQSKNNSIQQTLQIKFKNSKLLQKALTHRSYLNESKRALESNERLEYLGDAVLELVVSKFLYHQFPKKPEGQLTSLRSKIVQTKTLAHVAKKLKLGKFLKMSKGEAMSGGRANLSLLADTLEAVIGAIYLDQAFNGAESFIKKNLLQNFQQIISQARVQDYKSLLQEKVQAQEQPSPIYKIVKTVGPDHNRIFTAAVSFFNKIQGRGQGRSKQEAEQEAAKKALEKINNFG